jgi:hypothetical protein
MQFDEMVTWLITAMGFTAVAFLFWTLAALVKRSRSTGLSLDEQGAHNFHGPAHGDRRSN